ncbi:glycerol kinase [Peptoniphilus asaccharolyticus DSM 20463]|uniref:Glycerol kinase n=1 Tax=Peptoniphilus asaccharolyticus DSM 20463 TaxID=573058 RepID=A0A1W1VGB2_PEPAS|nr:glycerol kinase GlpK [Peptoniphilus asaccharolyticus]MBL7575877.1 glycerol kinase GlpK [Peptoniphilus asaccharolyticus]SMB92111.1 glycerol kinase [Peptoniphilus asaccharolyticus DSM 20463]
MKKYIMAFDSGTTSCRTLIFDSEFNIISSAQKELKQIFPKPGWVEEDPNEIFSTQLGTAVEAMAKMNINANDIAAIGITNQRETTIVWDRQTGEVIYNAIVWQCRRTSKYCDSLREVGYRDEIYKKTGLEVDAYFSATKIKWILDNVSGARERAERGELLFGTVDTFLIWKLTKGVHVTDYSNASRTMLYNINTLEWDDELLKLMDIPKSMLPEVKETAEVYGETAREFFGEEIKIASAVGDQQAALFGQGCFKKAEAKNTYGTGAFLLMNTGDKKVESKNGLVSTIAWGIDGKITYALEGSILIAGSSIQWLRDDLKLIDSAEDSEYLANKVSDTEGCYVVPAFTGLGAPYWNQYARGTICGLTRSVKKAHLVRATLESMAYLSNDVLKAMEEDLGALKILKVDGGASANDFLMQFQADIIDREVVRPKDIESTVRGAAFLAALGVGMFSSIDEISEKFNIDKNFIPNMAAEVRENKLKLWRKAVSRAFDWAEE